MSKVLVLRTSNHDGKAHSDFQWPASGRVECPDWNPNPVCGGGLHGILWPEGNWSDIKTYDAPLWQVVSVEETDIVKIEGKVKFRCGDVVYSGEFAVALNMVAKAWLDAVPADYSKLMVEVSASNSQITEDAAQIGSSGNDARIGSSGNDARIGSSGNDAQIGSSGYAAQIGSSGYAAQIGSSGYAARIDAQGEHQVIACAGSVSRFRAGAGSCITAPWYDGTRTRFIVGYVGEDLEANTWYVIRDGKFVKA